MLPTGQQAVRGTKLSWYYNEDSIQARKVALASHVIEAATYPETLYAAQSLSANEMRHLAQDIPDEVWYTIANQVMETEKTARLSESGSHAEHLSRVMLTKLAVLAEKHDFVRANQDVT